MPVGAGPVALDTYAGRIAGIIRLPPREPGLGGQRGCIDSSDSRAFLRKV